MIDPRLNAFGEKATQFSQKLSASIDLVGNATDGLMATVADFALALADLNTAPADVVEGMKHFVADANAAKDIAAADLHFIVATHRDR